MTISAIAQNHPRCKCTSINCDQWHSQSIYFYRAEAANQDNRQQKQADAAVDLINYKGIYFDDDSGEKY